LQEAALAGVEIRTAQQRHQPSSNGQIEVASPGGLDRLSAERVILATGLREAPRSARLIGGDRPWASSPRRPAEFHLSGAVAPLQRP